MSDETRALRAVVEWLEGNGDGLIVQDADDRIVVINEAAVRMIGFTDMRALREAYAQLSALPGPPPGVRVLDAGGREVPFESWPVVRARRREAYDDVELTLVSAGPDRSWTGRFSGRPLPAPDGGRGGYITWSQDLTARRHILEHLEGHMHRLRAILDLSSDAIWSFDAETDRTIWNEAMAERFGHRDAVTHGTDLAWWYAHLHPDDLPRAKANVTRYRTTDRVRYESEYRFRRADGTYAYVLSRGVAVPGRDGRAGVHLGTLIDLSARRQAEAEVRDSRERLALAHRLVGIGAWDYEPASDQMWFSPELCELYGLEAAPATGAEALLCCHPDDRERIQRYTTAVLHDGTTWDVEFRVPHPTRGLRWIAGMGRVVRDEAGAPVRMTGVNIDVTARRDAEAEAERAHARLRELTDAVPVLISCFDTDERYIFVNAAYERTWAVPREQLVGRRVEHLIGPDAWRVARPYAREALAGRAVQFENRLRRPGGGTWIADVRFVPLFGRDGAVQSVCCVATDISRLKEVEAFLRELNRSLEDRVAERTAQLEEHAARLRLLAAELVDSEQQARRRVAEVIHDHLQQLLVAARMRTALARHEQAPGGVARHLDETDALLGEAVSVSRSLSVELRPPVLYEEGLGPALRWLAANVREQHGLEVAVRIERTAEPAHVGTRTLLFTAARELLFNVVKHAGVGLARLELRRARGGRLLVRVQDAGVGFDAALAASARGGLGLFSIRERARALGGDLSVEAGPGAGTRVDLTVPAALAAVPTPTPAAPRSTALRLDAGAPVRVLLVDDHALMREALAALLAGHPRLVVVGQAGGGDEALALARTLRPALVLMDVDMPVVNGIEATRRLCAEMPEIAVIGVTAHDDAATTAAMRAAGAVDCVSKVSGADALVRAIGAFVGGGGTGVWSAPTVVSPR